MVEYRLLCSYLLILLYLYALTIKAFSSLLINSKHICCQIFNIFLMVTFVVYNTFNCCIFYNHGLSKSDGTRKKSKESASVLFSN